MIGPRGVCRAVDGILTWKLRRRMAGTSGERDLFPEGEPREVRTAWTLQDEGLAEWTGLEPATPGVTGRYSNQLNYHSIVHPPAPCTAGGC